MLLKKQYGQDQVCDLISTLQDKEQLVVLQQLNSTLQDRAGNMGELTHPLVQSLPLKSRWLALDLEENPEKRKTLRTV